MSQKTHIIRQYHGGGALVVAGAVKDAVLELMTGVPSVDPNETYIVDSGSAITTLCRARLSSLDVLRNFIKIMPDVLPEPQFYFSQIFSSSGVEENFSRLRRSVETILGDLTLKDFPGSLYVGAFDPNTQEPITIKKIIMPDGTARYDSKIAGPDTRLSDIALMSAAIPGVFVSSTSNDEETTAITDAIVNQPPGDAIKTRIDIEPDCSPVYVQVGNIEVKTPKVHRGSSVLNLFSQHYARFQTNVIHKRQEKSARIAIKGDPLVTPWLTGDRDSVFSLITYSDQSYWPTNPSIDQATRIIVETLRDVEANEGKYLDISRHILDARGLQQQTPRPLADVLAEIKQELDPILRKKTVFISNDNEIPDIFPSPKIIWAPDSKYYDPAKRAGRFVGSISPTFSRIAERHLSNILANFDDPKYGIGFHTGRTVAKYAPKMTSYLIQADFDVKEAFRLAWKSGLERLNIGSQKDKEKDPSNDEGGTSSPTEPPPHEPR